MEVKKTAMILEGGALRGVYTSGVLDVMMLHHLKFSHVRYFGRIAQRFVLCGKPDRKSCGTESELCA